MKQSFYASDAASEKILYICLDLCEAGSTLSGDAHYHSQGGRQQHEYHHRHEHMEAGETANAGQIQSPDFHGNVD